MGIEVRVTVRGIGIFAFGEISWPDLAGLGARLREIEEELPTTPNRVMDLSSSAVTNIDFGKILSFSAIRNKAVLKNSIRTAIVAPTDLHFGIARMFQSTISNPQIEFQIFRTSEEAWDWAAPVEIPAEVFREPAESPV
jgi:hypothetical protein